MLSINLDMDTTWDDLTFLLESVVISLNEISETELSGDEDLLSSWELELGSSEGFLSVLDITWKGSNGHEDLTNVDSCRFTEWLTPSVSHTLLESISTSAGKHLVDSDCVPWMDSGSHVEVFFTNVLGHVLVACNTGSFESFGGNLFLFVANQMDAGWEIVMSCLLSSNIVDSELWIWDTSVESGFWIWLVLLVSVAP